MLTKQRRSILIMTESPPKSYSPASERLFHMALAAGSIFDKVVLLTLQGSTVRQTRSPRIEHNSTRVLLQAINFRRAVPYPLSGLFDPIKFLVILVHGLVLCRREKFSCVVAAMPPIETGASAFLLAKLMRMRLVIDLMDDWESVLASQISRYVPRRLMDPFFKVSSAIYSRSNSIFAVTRTLEKKIRQRGIQATVIRAPNGADTELFFPRAEAERAKTRAQFGFPRNKIVIAYSGSGGNPYYRLDLLVSSINALQKSQKDGMFFVLYLYDQIEAFERMKSRFRMPDGLIQIRKPLPRSQLAKVLSACDIGIVPFDDKPYLKYATSTKLFEYISTGLYVVGTGPERGELESILSACPAYGLFVHPQVSDVASSLSKVVQKGPDLFDDNSRNLRHSFISENYDLEKTMKKVMRRLYASIFETTASRQNDTDIISSPKRAQSSFI